MKDDQPRHFAERIMNLKTKDERRAALELVPEDVRHIVYFYVASAFARRNKTPLPNLNRTSTHADSDGTGYCRGCGTTIGESHHADCDCEAPDNAAQENT